jgi:hypothetical protein
MVVPAFLPYRRNFLQKATKATKTETNFKTLPYLVSFCKILFLRHSDFAFYYDHEDDDEDDFIAVCRGGSIRGEVLFQIQIHTIEIDDGMMRSVVSAVLSGNSLCCASICPRITLIDANERIELCSSDPNLGGC